VARDIKSPVVIKKLFDDLGARFAARPGGYTRILRLGPRQGDGAEMAIVELIGSEWKPEKKDDKDKQGEKGKAQPAAKADSSKRPRRRPRSRRRASAARPRARPPSNRYSSSLTVAAAPSSR
jgi:hypothetical protein